MMAIEGAIVTINAMGCQRNIAEKILDKKADYVLALKGNQSTLSEDVEVFAAEQKANGFKDTKVSRHQTVDGDHGRIETRTYTAIHDVAWLVERHDWPGLRGVVMVESTREIGDKIERETRFYITSLVLLASALDLIPDFARALDHDDAAQSRPIVAFHKPSHIMDCGIGSGFDAAVIAVDRLMATDLGILKAVGLLLGSEDLDILA